MRHLVWSLCLAGTLAAAPSAFAGLHEGDLAPNFTKTDLNNITHTLYNYRGKVVVLFLLGHNCPVCLSQASTFQVGVWQHYQSQNPGQVVVLGPDVWSGTVPQLQQFRVTTGVTFPLLLQAGLPDDTDSTNLNIPYNEQDNYVVINKQGIIRYHAYDRWTHGNRLHVDEIKATVDSLVTNLAGVGERPIERLALSAAPNPFRSAITIELSNPFAAGTHARVTVFDLAGRRVARLWEGAAAAGITRLSWDGHSERGGALEPGIYLVQAEVSGRRVVRRVVLTN